jgi:hypothetical protein
MGFKRGLIVGFAGGYVLGARAGRERYNQINAWWNQLTGNPKVQEFTEKGKEIAGTASRRGLEVVQQGAQKVTSTVKERVSGGEEDTTGSVSLPDLEDAGTTETTDKGFSTGETSL